MGLPDVRGLKKRREEWRGTTSGEVFHFKTPLLLHIACCDCGLVHDFLIAKRKSGIEIKITRDNRRTGQLRRYRKHLCQPIIRRVIK